MRIYWRGLYNIMDESKIGVKEISAPFKGVCDHCQKRVVVRHYPYSWVENFGVFCKYCYKSIEDDLNSLDLNYTDEDFD